MDAKYGGRTGVHGLWPRRPRDYGHLHHQQHAALIGIMMSQYNMKKGIKLFGQAGIDAVLSELEQLHERKVMEPKEA